MNKKYNLFYHPETTDFEIFMKHEDEAEILAGDLEFRTEVTADELELQLVSTGKEGSRVLAFGFPQVAAFNPELSSDLYKIMELQQVVLVTEKNGRYTFRLTPEDLANIKTFMHL